MDNLCDSFGPLVSGYRFKRYLWRFHPLVAGDCAGGVTPESNQRPETRGLGDHVCDSIFFTLPCGTRHSVGEGFVCPSIWQWQAAKSGVYFQAIRGNLPRDAGLKPAQISLNNLTRRIDCIQTTT